MPLRHFITAVAPLLLAASLALHALPAAGAPAGQAAPTAPLALLAGPSYQFDGAVYAVQDAAVYRTHSGSTQWERVAALAPDRRNARYTGAAVAASGPNRAELLLTTSDLRLLRVPLPLDGGDRTEYGLPYFADDVRALLPSPKFEFDQTLYIVTPNTIFRTSDGGASWSRPGSWGETVRATLLLQGGAMLALGGDQHALLLERENGTVIRLDPASVNWYGVPAGSLPPNPVAVTAGADATFELIDAVTGAARRVPLREVRGDPALRGLRQAGTVGPEQRPAPGAAPESLPSPDGRYRLYLGEANTLLLDQDGSFLRAISITLGGSDAPPRALWWPNSAGFLLLVKGRLYTEQVSGLTARLVDLERPERLWDPGALRWFNLTAPPPAFEYYFWFDDQNAPPGPLDALLPSPKFDLDHTIYAVKGNTLHQSIDGGSTWTAAAGALLPRGQRIVAAALAVADANRFDLLLLTANGALYRVDLADLPQRE